MNLMIGAALLSDVVAYCFHIAVSTDGVGIEPTRPKLSTPEHFFYLGVAEKDFLCRYAFCDLGYSGWGQAGTLCTRKCT
ncbi:MAG: hypothetical protein A4E57_03575 [Syntrophorhabdaceae bacterium PtaU1.Bin034]|jgi:hypothetical protein|nr:MAG: hypothetical protein A4E57_03575 [Syntrophorhabdaceae bacterium PtaU1.Bin034]